MFHLHRPDMNSGADLHLWMARSRLQRAREVREGYTQGRASGFLRKDLQMPHAEPIYGNI
jgi:hypothetical protein